MTRNQWAVFDSMLERDELERIGISEDRHILLCLTRLCHEYGHKLTLLSRCVPWLERIIAQQGQILTSIEETEIHDLLRELTEVKHG